MSNYVYEEPIVIPNYSSSITLTSGSSTKMYDGSALFNHTITQSNFSITDLNTNTKCSNIKFTATYSDFPSITAENTSIQNSFNISNKKYFINNNEDITQYILPKNENIISKFGSLSITDNPAYPNIGGGNFVLNGVSFSGTNTVWGYNQYAGSGSKGTVSPSKITINNITYTFAYQNNGCTMLAYSSNIQTNGLKSGYMFWLSTSDTSLKNRKIYIKNTSNNKYKILPFIFSGMEYQFAVESATDDLNFKNTGTNISLEIYVI